MKNLELCEAIKRELVELDNDLLVQPESSSPFIDGQLTGIVRVTTLLQEHGIIENRQSCIPWDADGD